LVLFHTLMFGLTFAWLFVGVSALIGVMLPPRYAFWGTMVLTLFTLGICVGVSGGLASTDWLQIIPLILLVRGLGLDLTGLVRLSEALRELDKAREELARQAVIEERLRLARDLHDLLGHTLSTITLKSELASRLIGKEPDRASQEIREVERVARQGLREVRQAVAGYRKHTLQGELENARQILEAAGIGTTVEQTAGTLTSEIDAVLAWVVREGVTNVIRHSRARRCSIRIARYNEMNIRAEMINDGFLGQQISTLGAGSGLTGLAERVAAHGDYLEAGPQATGTSQEFRLSVQIPLQNNVLAEAR
jgi:two-component system sensor histidine kinase DesK